MSIISKKRRSPQTEKILKVPSKKTIKKWIPINGRLNYVLQGKGFYLSYTSDTKLNSGRMGLDKLVNMLGGDVKEGEETALKRRDGEWCILEGDFRKEYSKAFPLYKRILKVYEDNKQYHSNWSTD